MFESHAKALANLATTTPQGELASAIQKQLVAAYRQGEKAKSTELRNIIGAAGVDEL